MGMVIRKVVFVCALCSINLYGALVNGFAVRDFPLP
jgi:hypothetical protein